LTKQFAVPICVDETTAEYARKYLNPSEGRLRCLARVRPKGMDTPITVYGLLPPLEEMPNLTQEIIVNHEAAVEAIIRGDWPDAISLLQQIPEGDGPKAFLLNQMSEYGNMPPKDWDGAFSLASK
jgi:adenylate cyclase